MSGSHGDDAEGVGVDARARIGVAGVPAGDLGVVVEDVADVPAEDDVAEAEPVSQRAPELVERDVLAAQDAVDVEPADLHLLDAPLLEHLTELFCIPCSGLLVLRGARYQGPFAE